jgi:putative ABC transport system ATP-binding protein
MVILKGPSGSGKTTLLTIIGGLRRPQEGTCIVKGQNISNISRTGAAEFRRSIGFVFQQHNLLGFLNVRDNILMSGVLGRSMSKSGLVEKIKTYLMDVGLSGLLRRFPKHLSVGQKQRVSIIRALINDPVLILADEPTASLDWESANRVMQIFKQQVKEQGKSVILVSHDDRLFAYADRVVNLLDGRIVS